MCNKNFQVYICRLNCFLDLDNCFNRLRFLAEVSTKLQKCTFFDNLRTITEEANMEARQMTAFFSPTSSALTVYNINFCTWKYSKFIFMCSPLWSILVCCESVAFRQKLRYFTSIFDGKLPVQTADHTSLESRHPELTKNPYYVVHPPEPNTHFLGSNLWTKMHDPFENWVSRTKNYSFNIWNKCLRKESCRTKFILFILNNWILWPEEKSIRKYNYLFIINLKVNQNVISYWSLSDW